MIDWLRLTAGLSSSVYISVPCDGTVSTVCQQHETVPIKVIESESKFIYFTDSGWIKTFFYQLLFRKTLNKKKQIFGMWKNVEHKRLAWMEQF